jgi:gamma-glutamylaminecyclotransferase
MNASLPPTILFIYGTLKRNGSNHRHLVGQQFLGEARTSPGYRLYIVADYPGMVSDTADQRGVSGELWAVDSAKLAELDAFEGVPEKLYRRAPISLISPHQDQVAQTYLYLRNTRGRQPIINGHWPVAQTE